METTPIKVKVCESTPQPAQSASNSTRKAEPMSAVLRDRLKRTRRTFRSPLSVVKRLKIEDDNQTQTSQAEDTYQSANKDTDFNQNDMRRQRDGLHNTEHDLIKQCEELRKQIKQKEETLRRLKMVKMYRKKNDLTQLQRLIEKWRCCAQSVLYELQSELSAEGKQNSLSQIIDNLGLDDKILHFDRTEENFTDT